MLLAGCSGGEDEPVRPDVQGSQSGDSPGELRFGQTHEGQIGKTVREFEPFEIVSTGADEWMPANPAGEQGWAVEIEFENRTGQPWSPILLEVTGTVDGRPAQEIADDAQGFPLLNSVGEVAPGESVTVPVAFTGRGEDYAVEIGALDRDLSVTFHK